MKQIKSTFERWEFEYKDFFSKCDQIRSFLQMLLRLLKKSLKQQQQIWDISQRSRFRRSIAHRKNFGLIWKVVFKLEYLFCQGRYDTSFKFEWTWRKIANENYTRKFRKQAITKFLLVITFVKYFSWAKSNHTYSFDQLLIFFTWL